MDSKFDHNLRSLFIFNSILNFSGYTDFENSAEPLTSEPGFTAGPISDDIDKDSRQFKEGGAITIFRATVTFAGVTKFFNNQASDGGAILATESTIMMSGITTITNNMATVSNGGGIPSAALSLRSVITVKFCKILPRGVEEFMLLVQLLFCVCREIYYCSTIVQ